MYKKIAALPQASICNKLCEICVPFYISHLNMFAEGGYFEVLRVI
jgi:hypothetical protein